MKPATAIYTAFDDVVHLDPAEPEKNLMRAILRGAMEDYRKSGEPFTEARSFFLANNEYYLFSFISICRHLDLCPRTIRTVLGVCDDSDRGEQSLAA